MARAKSRSRTQAKSRSTSRRGNTRGTSSRNASSRSAPSRTGSARGASASRGSRGRSTSNGTSRRGGAARNDAISLLKNDHRQVEGLFAQFEKARGEDRKQEIATRVCDALRVHSQLEEEVFYPAFYEATGEEDLHHEAIIEHDGVKKLIAEIESSGPGDEYFDARVTVLSEMVKHHVKEEEQRDGILAKARGSDMDLAALGEQMAQLKSDLESSPDAMKALGRAKEAGKGLLTRLTSAA